jgi:predicted glycosyltransferase
MKTAIYCQHVLGIGHFFRTLEICRALQPHPVVLITGGPEAPAALPSNVRRVQLPELAMDATFQHLHARGRRSLAQTREQRRTLLEQTLSAEKPDLFLIELYPLGRKAFRNELDPLLAGIRNGRLPACRVVCSVRDILVEKEDRDRHEARAVETLNRWFDALLVHADPSVIRLETTFGRLTDVRIPVVYTGFVAPPIGPTVDGRAWKNARGMAPDEILVVASAGSGAVGFPLLDAVTQAVRHLPGDLPWRLQVFTGPFMEEQAVRQLTARIDRRIAVDRFTADLPAWLQAADLSISMAGYNTCMAVLATGVRALVLPFTQNREQGLRARLLADRGRLGILEEEDLDPQRLARRMVGGLRATRPEDVPPIDLAGAVKTARWITEGWTPPGGKP